MKLFLGKILTFYRSYTLFIKYSISNIILRIEMSRVNLKIICEKAKADTQTPNSRQGGHSFITEMAVFTLETDYSCEMGYPFDNSRQIANTS